MFSKKIKIALFTVGALAILHSATRPHESSVLYEMISSDKESAQPFAVNPQGARLLQLMLIEDASSWIKGAPSAFDYSQLIEKPKAVTANALWRIYNKNEIQADNLYKGEKVLVTGEISAIEKDFFQNPIIRLSTPQAFMSVMAYLSDAAVKEASEYNPGQNIALMCTGDGVILGSPIARDCSTISQFIKSKVSAVLDDWLSGNDLRDVVETDGSMGKPLLFIIYWAFSKYPPDSPCLVDLGSAACHKKTLEAMQQLENKSEEFRAAYNDAQVFLHLPPFPEKLVAAPATTTETSQESTAKNPTDTAQRPTSEIKPTDKTSRLTPAPIRNVISDSDWASVKSALAFAYSLGDAKDYVQWSNNINGHSGTVYQSGAGKDQNGCRQFRVSRKSGAGALSANVEACDNGNYH